LYKKIKETFSFYITFFFISIACDMDPWGIAIAKAYCFAESAEAMWYLPKVNLNDFLNKYSTH
jgi:DNA topoisomerase VI subunit A